jgi:hypothetical protein
MNRVALSQGLAAGFLAVAAVSTATPSNACSMMPGYKVPTNLELAAAADTIVVTVVTGERAGSDRWSGTLLTHPITLLKGASLPDLVEVTGATIANDPNMARMVVPSAPRELRAPNPGAMIGGCVRYIFSKGMKLVLFLKRDEAGKLIPFRSSFSRDAEDVVDENALWVKAVREYAAISLTPKSQWKSELRKRTVALGATASDVDAQAIAKDMEIELSGKRRPAYD